MIYIVYLNNIIVYSNNYKVYTHYIQIVLERLQEYKLYINLKNAYSMLLVLIFWALLSALTEC